VFGSSIRNGFVIDARFAKIGNRESAKARIEGRESGASYTGHS